jgi:hypothetical protein
MAELADNLPAHAVCLTVHSLGQKIIASARHLWPVWVI